MSNGSQFEFGVDPNPELILSVHITVEPIQLMIQ